MGHLQPELKVMKDQLEKMGDNIDQATQLRYSQQTRALFRKYDCNPLISILAPLASAPIFMSMFFALRNAPEYFPELLSTGGMFWFTDLTAPDPYCIMPLFSAATFLGMTEVGKEQMMASDPARGRVMVNAFRALAVVMVPLTMNFNSGVFVYWTTNNTWSFVQAMALKQPMVKKYFGIWDPPKPVPGQPTANLFDELKNLTTKKEKEAPNAWAEDRIKAHNDIIEQQKLVKKKLMEKERAARAASS
jgi:YidC/Oxa1 family membrane protein insertase